MNQGILNRAKCIESILELQEENLSRNIHETLKDVLNALSILPEHKRDIDSIKKFTRKNNLEKNTIKLCLEFWKRQGVVNNKNKTYDFRSYEAHSKCEALIRDAKVLKEFYTHNNEVSYHKVTEQRKITERKNTDNETIKFIISCLKSRNLKEASFLFVDLDNKEKKEIPNSLAIFLEYNYYQFFHKVILNESFSIGQEFIHTLDDNERRVLESTLNIFLADGEHFTQDNLNEASNLSIQMALSKAKRTSMVGLWETLQSIESKLDKINEEIANSVGTSGAVSPLGPRSIVGDPPGKKKKKKREQFAGADIFKVSEEEYGQCMPGSIKYERWAKIFSSHSSNGHDIKSNFQKNPNRPFVVQNEKTGEMMFFRRHDTRGEKK
jgi:hypothetical protein